MQLFLVKLWYEDIFTNKVIEDNNIIYFLLIRAI